MVVSDTLRYIRAPCSPSAHKRSEPVNHNRPRAARVKSLNFWHRFRICFRFLFSLTHARLKKCSTFRTIYYTLFELYRLEVPVPIARCLDSLADHFTKTDPQMCECVFVVTYGHNGRVFFFFPPGKWDALWGRWDRSVVCALLGPFFIDSTRWIINGLQ